MGPDRIHESLVPSLLPNAFRHAAVAQKPGAAPVFYTYDSNEKEIGKHEIQVEMTVDQLHNLLSENGFVRAAPSKADEPGADEDESKDEL